MFREFYIFGLLMCSICSKGQEVDSTAFVDERLHTLVFHSGMDVFSIVPDSTEYVSDLWNLHMESSVKSDGLYGFNLGNSGSLVNRFRRRGSGFDWGWNITSPYQLRIDDIPIKITKKAFSRARYSNGTGAENILEAELVSRFGKLLFAGFHFDRVRSVGYYSKQITDNTEIDVFSGVHSKNHRYKALLIFGWNGINNDENGGVVNDSVFEFGSTGSREFLAVNLNSAERRINDFGLNFDHGFFLQRVGTDSSLGMSKNRFRLYHKFKVRLKKSIYKDVPDSTFYQNIYLDSLATLDSTGLLSIRNEIGVQFVRSKTDSVFIPWLYVYGAQEFVDAATDTLSVLSNNLSVGGKLTIPIRKMFRFNSGGEVWLYGYNQGDLTLDAGFSARLQNWKLVALADFSLHEVSWKNQHYSSNNFRWNNSYDKESDLNVGIRVSNSKLNTDVRFDYRVLGNMVYYDTSWMPQQAMEVQQLVSIRLEQPLAWRWFHLDVLGKLSKLLSGNAMSLPLFTGRGSIYYENRLFKRRLTLQVGMDVWYYTKFEAYGYNPALAEFTRSSERLIGNYPYLDAWLSIRRKKLSVFFKVKHWNAGLMGQEYYNHLHYPANDLAIKFGLDWIFLD